MNLFDEEDDGVLEGLIEALGASRLNPEVALTEEPVEEATIIVASGEEPEEGSGEIELDSGLASVLGGEESQGDEAIEALMALMSGDSEGMEEMEGMEHMEGCEEESLPPSRLPSSSPASINYRPGSSRGGLS